MGDLRSAYEARFSSVLLPLAGRLEEHVIDTLSGVPRIDHIKARAKSVERFMDKAVRTEAGTPKYSDPLSQIQDQLGARVVVHYLDDVDKVAAETEKYFRPIEMRDVVPDTESAFGYFGRHYVLFIPSDITHDIPSELAPHFFELQIKTLFQHAWGEANHDLGYKPDHELQPDEKRCIAFASAQAWGADRMFNELHRKAT